MGECVRVRAHAYACVCRGARVRVLAGYGEQRPEEYAQYGLATLWRRYILNIVVFCLSERCWCQTMRPFSPTPLILNTTLNIRIYLVWFGMIGFLVNAGQGAEFCVKHGMGPKERQPCGWGSRPTSESHMCCACVNYSRSCMQNVIRATSGTGDWGCRVAMDLTFQFLSFQTPGIVTLKTVLQMISLRQYKKGA